ncbi:MAG: dihydroneopterin aldolase [Anaerolineales bacterium]
MDRVEIENLHLRCIIGINAWERKKKQDIIINIVMYADLREAGASDDIEHAVNYRTVTKAVIEHVEQSDYCLVEALAGSVAAICMKNERVSRVDVSVQKPGALRFADSVGVTITRDRDDFPR